MWGSPRIYFRANLIHTLMCNVSTLLKSILFADDTNLFYSGKDIDELYSVVSIELDKLCIIMFSSEQTFPKYIKTHFMVFTNRSCDDTYSVDIIDLNSSVFMYKAFHNVLPTNLLSYFKKVNDSHNHNTRNNTLSLKVRFRRTSKKALSICIIKVLKCGMLLVQTSN